MSDSVEAHDNPPPERWHKLLSRQLRRHFGTFDHVPADLLPLFDHVQQAYRQADEDRELMEHSLETVSRELADRLARMQSAIGEREAVKRAYAELESTQEQLRQSQKMEAIGQLAGGVAHDFNNLLTVINGNIELVLSTPDLPPPARDLLREVVTAAERAAKLTSQLLAYSRKQMLRQTVFDLADSIAGLRPVLGVAIGPRITLQMETRPSFVRADRTQIDQVLLNLVINARDAMRGDGTMQVSCRTERVTAPRVVAMGDELPPGTYSVLRVSDTGTGIPEELRERVFEPFFTTKPTGEGTGLGLSMVYGLVRQTGGYVQLESVLAAGTVVHIYLPKAEPENLPNPESVRSVERAGPAARLLVVDDEGAVRRLLVTVLRGNGFAVLEAPNGRAALEVIEGTPEPFDLVVSDVVMPELDGREFSRRLRGIRPDLPVLFVSGYSPEEIADFGEPLDDGVALLSKPFSVSQLLTSIRSMLP